ncbi:nickel ABC transporter ATP-binding protein NikE [Microbacterium sp. NPDC058342]|uniref:nickel ABC transporter ATP-binding protein NikE n=1 Tax=Microbacterium sp. NPDC058342 TaxID=3346454 RepID=UPI003647A879
MNSSPSQPARRLLDVESFSVFAGMGSERRTLVSDVTLSLGAGDTAAIVGESGSGKSMLVKGITKLLPHGTSAEGAVWFDGQRIDRSTQRRLRSIRGRRMSLLLQDPFTILNPLQTVGTTIAESFDPTVRRRPAEVRAEVERRLDEVGIDGAVARKRPFELSGGMRQRVAMAAALASDPELLIADEPTTALDSSTQDDVLRLLASFQSSRGMALLLITHDLRIAFDMCDTIHVMYAGSIVESGSSSRLLEDVGHPYTAGLMVADPLAESYTDELAGIPGTVPAADAVAERCPFSDRCSWATDACRSGRPQLVPIGVGRLSRCIRIDTIRTELRDAVLTSARPAPRPAYVASEELLRIEGLTKRFTTQRLVGRSISSLALAGVDLTIGAGESVGLIGESGSGKTTIARSIVGLSRSDAGLIVLDGVDISDYRRLSRAELHRVRRSVQTVFQDPFASLNRSHTVRTAIREAIVHRGDSVGVDAEIRELLDRVSLPSALADRYPSALSGGQRQRVSIARALAMRPRLLICDEPVAALDVSVQAQILELLRSIRKESGTGMLFITHDLAVARQMADRLVVLRNGTVVEHGGTDTVLDSPQHSYTRKLVAAIPPPHGIEPHPADDPIVTHGPVH